MRKKLVKKVVETKIFDINTTIMMIDKPYLEKHMYF